MKNLKNISSFLVLTLVIALFTACGTKETPNKNDGANTNNPAKETTNTSDEGNTGDEGNTNNLAEIVVGASIEPHASILNSDAVKKSLEEQGYKIKVVEYTDYIQPNVATTDGSLDANFFQHTPYLNDYNEKNGTVLKAVANIHFEPLGIYPGKSSSLTELADGAQIAVPNDATNEARALLLLEKAGLIKLNENASLDATINDIVENPKNLKIVEIEAAQTAKALRDVDLAVINGNYALLEGLTASKDALLVEDVESEAAYIYANILVVNEGNEESDKTRALIKAVTSEETKTFIKDNWQGAVVPVF